MSGEPFLIGDPPAPDDKKLFECLGCGDTTVAADEPERCGGCGTRQFAHFATGGDDDG